MIPASELWVKKFQKRKAEKTKALMTRVRKGGGPSYILHTSNSKNSDHEESGKSGKQLKGLCLTKNSQFTAL